METGDFSRTFVITLDSDLNIKGQANHISKKRHLSKMTDIQHIIEEVKSNKENLKEEIVHRNFNEPLDLKEEIRKSNQQRVALENIARVPEEDAILKRNVHGSSRPKKIKWGAWGKGFVSIASTSFGGGIGIHHMKFYYLSRFFYRV